MRRSLLASIFLAGLVTLASARPALGAVSVSVAVFHRTLAPYGRWITTVSYGDVWAPSVAAGWQPYVDGEWYYTDCGWTWASSDPWGDIPFHYGTWVWEPPYGWVWVPGTIWAPAWVTWAYSDDFVGWAPVPPSFALSASGYVGTPIVMASNRYVFVPARQFVGVRVASVRLPARRNPAVFAHTIRTTSFHVSGGVLHDVGPAPQRIARAVGRPIQPVPIAKAGVRPVSLTESGVARGRRLAVVAPKAERAAAISKPSAAVHARPNRSVERPHATSIRPGDSPRQPPAAEARPAKAVVNPARPEQAAAKPERAVARPARPDKPQAASVARHPAPQPERIAAARPPAPRPKPKPARPPQKPNPPHPQNPDKDHKEAQQ
ncbi:MAG TPA: DUF6600 domain-containing protein [Thermoanaerobaculia bacterium]|nr:DUF6600 domain-containing protein [Thermoanaerobaculia bacterium]